MEFTVVTIALMVVAILLSPILYSPVALFYFLYKWAKKKNKTVGRIILIIMIIVTAIITIFIAKEIYEAIIPNEKFYIDHFESKAEMKFPKSGKFIAKYASYPNHFGEYEAVALITLDSEDYSNLINKLDVDTNFEAYDSIPRRRRYLELPIPNEFTISKSYGIKNQSKNNPKGRFYIEFVNNSNKLIFDYSYP